MNRDATLLLTGTPLQNNTKELWALLNFLDTKRFPRFEDFTQEIGGEVENADELDKLHKILGPYMLRRMKEDVEKTLKAKQECIIEVELTSEQKRLYRAVYERNIGQLNKMTKDTKLMNIAMQLRKCCNHPFLLQGVEEQANSTALAAYNAGIADGSLDPATAQHPLSDAAVYDRLRAASGKLVLLDKLLPKLRRDGHRVLIFSQFVIMLDILNDYLTYYGFKFERLDGSVSAKARQQSIDRFSNPTSDAFIFLLSTRAGGVGINLTAADRVIIFDSDWNPQNDVQAMARCHRIGQKRMVTVFRLITKKTYEAQMFQRASLKLGLDKAVLHGMTDKVSDASKASGAASSSKSAALVQNVDANKPYEPTKDELNEILKYGAYDLFREEREGLSDAASKKFGEEDIESILNRAVMIQHENKNGNAMSSNFAKATFASADADEVDIADPDFWKKTVGEIRKVTARALSPQKRRKRQNYNERALAKGQWEDDDEDDYVVMEQARFTTSALKNFVKTLWQYGWSRADGMTMQQWPGQAEKQGIAEVRGVLRAFVALVAISYRSSGGRKLNLGDDKQSEFMAAGWSKVTDTHEFGPSAGTDRIRYRAPDGTYYDTKEEMHSAMGSDNEVISCLAELSNTFYICRKLLADIHDEHAKKQLENASSTSTSSSSSSSSEVLVNSKPLSFDTYRASLVPVGDNTKKDNAKKEFMRVHMQGTMALKWLNHLDDTLVVEKFVDEARALLRNGLPKREQNSVTSAIAAKDESSATLSSSSSSSSLSSSSSSSSSLPSASEADATESSEANSKKPNGPRSLMDTLLDQSLVSQATEPCKGWSVLDDVSLIVGLHDNHFHPKKSVKELFNFIIDDVSMSFHSKVAAAVGAEEAALAIRETSEKSNGAKDDDDMTAAMKTARKRLKQRMNSRVIELCGAMKVAHPDFFFETKEMKRARTVAERSQSKSGSRKPKKEKVRQWRTAFAIFMSKTLLAFKAERGKVPFGQASKEISALWKNMSEEERVPYHLLEEEEKVLYPRIKTEKQLLREKERNHKKEEKQKEKAANKAEREAQRAAEKARKAREVEERRELRAALALEKKEEREAAKKAWHEKRIRERLERQERKKAETAALAAERAAAREKMKLERIAEKERLKEKASRERQAEMEKKLRMKWTSKEINCLYETVQDYGLPASPLDQCKFALDDIVSTLVLDERGELLKRKEAAEESWRRKNKAKLEAQLARKQLRVAKKASKAAARRAEREARLAEGFSSDEQDNDPVDVDSELEEDEDAGDTKSSIHVPIATFEMVSLVKEGKTRLALSTDQFLHLAKNKFCVLAKYKTAAQIDLKIGEMLEESKYWSTKPKLSVRKANAKAKSAAVLETNARGKEPVDVATSDSTTSKESTAITSDGSSSPPQTVLGETRSRIFTKWIEDWAKFRGSTCLRRKNEEVLMAVKRVWCRTDMRRGVRSQCSTKIPEEWFEVTKKDSSINLDCELLKAVAMHGFSINAWNHIRQLYDRFVKVEVQLVPPLQNEEGAATSSSSAALLSSKAQVHTNSNPQKNQTNTTKNPEAVTKKKKKSSSQGPPAQHLNFGHPLSDWLLQRRFQKIVEAILSFKSSSFMFGQGSSGSKRSSNSAAGRMKKRQKIDGTKKGKSGPRSQKKRVLEEAEYFERLLDPTKGMPTNHAGVMRSLLAGGYVKPGKEALILDHHGRTFVAELCSNGNVAYSGKPSASMPVVRQEFTSINALLIFLKCIEMPENRNTADGYASFKYGGLTLKELRHKMSARATKQSSKKKKAATKISDSESSGSDESEDSEESEDSDSDSEKSDSSSSSSSEETDSEEEEELTPRQIARKRSVSFKKAVWGKSSKGKLQMYDDDSEYDPTVGVEPSSTASLRTKKLVTVTNLGTLKRKKTWYELGNGKLNLKKMNWSSKTKQRIRGKTAATSDTYYIPPNNCRQFRSFAEIKRFLLTPFHEKNQLIPSGFTSSVEEMSFKRKGKTTVYTQTTVDDSYRCLFKITAADAPNEPVIEATPDMAWSVLSERIWKLQEGSSTDKVQQQCVNGYKRFGLAIRKVSLLIEGLKGSERDELKKYRFGVMRRRKLGSDSKMNAKKRKKTSGKGSSASASGVSRVAGSASPSAKRAKIAKVGGQQISGELASPEPEQPLEDIVSPDGRDNGSADVPSPEVEDKFSPVVVDLASGSSVAEGAAAPCDAKAEKKKSISHKKQVNRKRKARGGNDASSKKQATLGAFFGK
jgi:hypothetical protein